MGCEVVTFWEYTIRENQTSQISFWPLLSVQAINLAVLVFEYNLLKWYLMKLLDNYSPASLLQMLVQNTSLLFFLFTITSFVWNSIWLNFKFWSKGKQNASWTILLTTLKSMMNVKLSLHGFWHCHENGLIKTIQTIPHNIYVSFKLASLYCGLKLILVYPNP